MTDTTKNFDTELDELLQQLSSTIAVNHVTSLTKYQKRRNEDDEAVSQVKEAIKQAVSSYIIGEDEERRPLDGGPFTNTIDNKSIDFRNSFRATQRQALHQRTEGKEE